MVKQRQRTDRRRERVQSRQALQGLEHSEQGFDCRTATRLQILIKRYSIGVFAPISSVSDLKPQIGIEYVNLWDVDD